MSYPIPKFEESEPEDKVTYSSWLFTDKTQLVNSPLDLTNIGQNLLY